RLGRLHHASPTSTSPALTPLPLCLSFAEAAPALYTLSLHDALPISAFLLNRVFMPPNLGGFFMVRSYYPSECHADYFDFERIERSEERLSRNAETELVCGLLLEAEKEDSGASALQMRPTRSTTLTAS